MKALALPGWSRERAWIWYLAVTGLLSALYLFAPGLSGNGPLINFLGLTGVLAIVAGIVIALIVAAVVALVRHFSAQPAQSAMPPAASSAEEVLAQRFARGEIDEDEYRLRRDALRE